MLASEQTLYKLGFVCLTGLLILILYKTERRGPGKDNEDSTPSRFPIDCLTDGRQTDLRYKQVQSLIIPSRDLMTFLDFAAGRMNEPS